MQIRGCTDGKFPKTADFPSKNRLFFRWGDYGRACASRYSPVALIFCQHQPLFLYLSILSRRYLSNRVSMRRSGINHMIATITYRAKEIHGLTKASGIAAM